MFSNLKAELARRDLTNRAVSDHLKISEAAFSNRMTGRQPFSDVERAALSRFLDVGESELFGDGVAHPARLASPIADLFKLLDDCVFSGGDPTFVLDKIYRMESREYYLASCAHLFGVLRARQGIPPKIFPITWTVTWPEKGVLSENFIIEPGPPRRADADTIWRAGGIVLHPILVPERENTSVNLSRMERR